MIDQPMHLRIKKGMLISLKDNRRFITALVISDVFTVTDMRFNVIYILSQGKKRKIRTTWVREIYDEVR